MELRCPGNLITVLGLTPALASAGLCSPPFPKACAGKSKRKKTAMPTLALGEVSKRSSYLVTKTSAFHHSNFVNTLGGCSVGKRNPDPAAQPHRPCNLVSGNVSRNKCYLDLLALLCPN